MDYRNNGNGSWTWYCEDCGKEETVIGPNKPRKIRSFSDWCSRLLPKMDLSWYSRYRMGGWLHQWGGMGLCKRCANRKIDFCLWHKSHEEEEDDRRELA